MVEAPLWDPSSPEFSRQEQSTLNYRGWFIISNTPTRGQIFINPIILYVYDARDVIVYDNFSTVLENFVNISLLSVAQVNSEKLSVLDRLILAKKWGISPKKSFDTSLYHTV